MVYLAATYVCFFKLCVLTCLSLCDVEIRGTINQNIEAYMAQEHCRPNKP